MLDHQDPRLSRRRRLPYQAVAALEVIALMGRQKLPWPEFELRMHERGCDSRACLTALACLERRNWASRKGGSLEITDSGYAAAIRGARATPSKRQPPKRHARLPSGLFG